MTIPKKIVENVKNGKCILFLGAGASAPSPKENDSFQYTESPPSGEELARRLAAKCGYQGNDINNLQRVSLYFEYHNEFTRHDLIDAIAEEITKPDIKPSPALHMLAALPFQLVITTNYDNLFEKALENAETADGFLKNPTVLIYNHESGPEDPPDEFEEQRPVLFKIHGDIKKRKSLVVTEEDYMFFIQRMSDNTHLPHPIHLFIRARLMKYPTLFIGYSLKDYNFRLLFRTLRWNADDAIFPLSFSVDPSPDNLIVSVWQEGDKRIVKFIKQDLWNFIPLLFKECLGKEYQEMKKEKNQL